MQLKYLSKMRTEKKRHFSGKPKIDHQQTRTTRNAKGKSSGCKGYQMEIHMDRKECEVQEM